MIVLGALGATFVVYLFVSVIMGIIIACEKADIINWESERSDPFAHSPEPKDPSPATRLARSFTFLLVPRACVTAAWFHFIVQPGKYKKRLAQHLDKCEPCRWKAAR